MDGMTPSPLTTWAREAGFDEGENGYWSAIDADIERLAARLRAEALEEAAAACEHVAKMAIHAKGLGAALRCAERVREMKGTP